MQQYPQQPRGTVQQVTMFGGAPVPQRPAPFAPMMDPREQAAMLLPDRRRFAVNAPADFGRGAESRMPAMGSQQGGSNSGYSHQHPLSQRGYPQEVQYPQSISGGSQSSNRTGRSSASKQGRQVAFSQQGGSTMMGRQVAAPRSLAGADANSERGDELGDDLDDASSVASTVPEEGDEVDLTPDDLVAMWTQKNRAYKQGKSPSPTDQLSSQLGRTVAVDASSSSSSSSMVSYSGNEAVSYQLDKAFTIALPLTVTWPERSKMKDPVYIVVPGKVLEAAATNYAYVMCADELSQLTQRVPMMSLMRRWFPFRVRLQSCWSSNVPVAYGVRWDNAVTRRHNTVQWGVCEADYDPDRQHDTRQPDIQQRTMLWVSARHRLFHEYAPAEPLVLSDLSAFLQSAAFCQNYIDVQSEYERSVKYARTITDHNQQQVRYMNVDAASHIALVLRKDMPEFDPWCERGPADQVYVDVPERMCKDACELLAAYMDGFVGYRGFLNDQIFRVVPLPKSPPGYVYQVSNPLSGGGGGPSSATMPSSSSPTATLPATLAGAVVSGMTPSFDQNLRDTAQYVIPCSEYAAAEGAISSPAEIMLTLLLDVCPALPLSPKEAEELGALSVANLQRASSSNTK